MSTKTNKKINAKDLAQWQFCLPHQCRDLARRQFLRNGINLVGYMTAAQFVGLPKAEAQTFTPLRKLVWINMDGGWDILEITDPKTKSTSGIDMSYTWSEAQHLAGAADNVKIGRWLKRLADHGEDVVIVRGLAMGTTSHMAGSVYMDTGVLSNAGRVNAASIPAIVASESSATIPIIQLNGGSEPLTDRGLLNPVSVVRAQNLELYRSMYPDGAADEALRMKILDYLNASITRLEGAVGTNDRLSAISTAESKIRNQIEDNVGSKLAVSDSDLAKYMKNAPTGMDDGMAQTFALAAKLIKNDLVTSINLGLGGFDTHANQEQRMKPIVEGFDFVLDKFIDDLRNAGKLDSTLIVCYSDFGRTPKVNGSNGRDHWPVGGAIMIGGGIDGGRAVGGTDSNLLAESINTTSGNVSSSGDQIGPGNLGGSVLELCLGSTYNYRNSYLEALPCLTRVKS